MLHTARSFRRKGRLNPVAALQRAAVFSCALALGACEESTPAATARALTHHTYAQPGLPERDYELFVPTSRAAGPMPLVVYLHGCNQTALDAIAGTLWNELGTEKGFAVAWPEQRLSNDVALDGNGARCWNWFHPAHFNRDAGEPATIAGITRQVMAAHDIDPSRVYVMGVSAGGEMAATLGATYPDLYAAIAIFAGGPYTGTDFSGALAAQAMGEYARTLPVIVLHGTADEAAVFPLGVAAVRQWLGTNDRVDDGLPNASVPPQPDSTEHHGFDASLLEGLGSPGDLCLGAPLALPCIAGALGAESYPHSIEHYLDAGGHSLIDFWIIHGHGHNYLGGSRAGSFSDPHGPNVTRAVYDFFTAHPMQ